MFTKGKDTFNQYEAATWLREEAKLSQMFESSDEDVRNYLEQIADFLDKAKIIDQKSSRCKLPQSEA